MDYLQEIGVGKCNGDVISSLRRFLDAEYRFSQNNQKPSRLDEKRKCNFSVLIGSIKGTNNADHIGFPQIMLGNYHLHGCDKTNLNIYYM
jgi:hypothetical protein